MTVASISIAILIVAFIVVVMMDVTFQKSIAKKKPPVISQPMIHEYFIGTNIENINIKPIKCAYCGRPLSDCGCGVRMAE